MKVENGKTIVGSRPNDWLVQFYNQGEVPVHVHRYAGMDEHSLYGAIKATIKREGLKDVYYVNVYELFENYLELDDERLSAERG